MHDVCVCGSPPKANHPKHPKEHKYIILYTFTISIPYILLNVNKSMYLNEKI